MTKSGARRGLFTIFFLLLTSFLHSQNAFDEFIENDHTQSFLSNLKRVDQDLYAKTFGELRKFGRHYEIFAGIETQSFSNKIEKEKTIPKIIHFIWLGPKSFPITSIRNLSSVIRNHPDYSFIFWTDRDRRSEIKILDQKLLDKIVFKDAGAVFSSHPDGKYCFDHSYNYGEQSDLLRYFILYDYGGVYVDHDIEAIMSLDIFVENLSFFCFADQLYAMVENQYFRFSNALIGCNKKNRIIGKTIDEVVNSWDHWSTVFNTINIDLFNNNNVELKNNRLLYNISTLLKTYIPFTKTIKQLDLDDTECVFPPQYSLLFPASKYKPYFIHYLEGKWLK